MATTTRAQGTRSPGGADGPAPPTSVALAWLSHPVTVAALALLLVNDHVLKAAWGSWWTGKLSDLAGLVVAPALVGVGVAGASRLAEVLTGAGAAGRVRRAPSTRAVVAWSTGVVGAGFVVVKTTAGGAAAASAVWSAVDGPGVVLRDPTDLVALPALVLAVLVARRVSTARTSAGAPGATRPTAWWVIVPVAVLATAATSAPPPRSADQVGVFRGELVVEEGGWGDWYVLRDDRTWERLSAEEGERVSAALAPPDDAAPDDARPEVCVPALPSECYRPADGLGVERSVDGGATWRVDWSVPAQDVPALAERYSPPTDEIATAEVVVLPVGGDFEVWAANGGDGLARRGVDGAWQRLGYAFTGDAGPVVPLPGEPTRTVQPVPWVVVLAVLAGAVTQLAGGRSRPGFPRPGAWTAVVCGVLAVGAAAAVNDASSAVEGQAFRAFPLLEHVVPVGALLVAVPLVAAGGWFLGFRAGLGPGAVVLVGVCLLALAQPAPVLALLVAAAACVTGVAAARLRGDRSGPLEDPPWPPLPPVRPAPPSG